MPVPSLKVSLQVLPVAAMALFPLPAAAQEDSGVKTAEAYAAAVLGDECDRNVMTDIPVGSTEPESFSHHVYPLTFRYAYEAADEPERKATLYQIFCGSGAYNIRSAYVLKLQEESGFRLVGFPHPALKTDYEDAGQTKLKTPPSVTGFTSRFLLVNPAFDPATVTIRSHSLWRGLGDAWDSGDWIFEDGSFALKRYEVDPTFDAGGKQEAPGSYVVFQAP